MDKKRQRIGVLPNSLSLVPESLSGQNDRHYPFGGCLLSPESRQMAVPYT